MKDILEPKLIKQDEEGRWMCIEFKIIGKKTLIINIYAPNHVKEMEKNFERLENIILELVFINSSIRGL